MCVCVCLLEGVVVGYLLKNPNFPPLHWFIFVFCSLLSPFLLSPYHLFRLLCVKYWQGQEARGRWRANASVIPLLSHRNVSRWGLRSAKLLILFFFFISCQGPSINQSSAHLSGWMTCRLGWGNLITAHIVTQLSFFFPDKKYIRLKPIRRLKPWGEPTVTHVPSDRSLFFHSSSFSSSLRAWCVNDSFGQKKPSQTQIEKDARATGLLNKIVKNPWCFQSKISANKI